MIAHGYLSFVIRVDQKGSHITLHPAIHTNYAACKNIQQEKVCLRQKGHPVNNHFYFIADENLLRLYRGCIIVLVAQCPPPRCRRTLGKEKRERNK